ncbi:hypothetical protein F5Y18DRAFT_408514, partial [Xylariaceae sp. FL1019]
MCDLQRNAKYQPFFQTFVDYRMGQGEVIHWGKENQLMIGLDLNVPYDVYLDIIDNPDGDGLHSFFLQRDLFGAAEAEKLTRSYELLVSAFAAEPDLVVADATI